MSKSPSTSVNLEVQTALTKRDIANLMPKAVEVMEEALRSSNEALAVSAAKYIIDQSVGKATQEIIGGGAAGTNALAEAAAMALKQILDTHPGLKNGIEEIPLMIENPETGVFEIGDPEQES